MGAQQPITTPRGALERGKWTHLAFVFNRGGGGALYKDGELAGTGQYMSTPRWGKYKMGYHNGLMLYTESGVSADVQVNKGTYLLDENGKKVHELLPHTGDITIHNNQAGRIPGAGEPGPFGMGVTHSSIVELKMPLREDGDFEKDAGRPFSGQVTWRYTPEPLSSWHAPFMSCASRPPNGNVPSVSLII